MEPKEDSVNNNGLKVKPFFSIIITTCNRSNILKRALDSLLRLKGFKNMLLGTDSDLFERAMTAGFMMKETEIPTYIYHHETEDSITNMLLSESAETEIFLNEHIPDN